jgi:hypothetical protein
MNEMHAAGIFSHWLPLALFALAFLYMLIHRQFRLGERSMDEVTMFLRRIDWSEMQEVFDLPRERYLKTSQPDRRYRRSMRVRIHAAREFMARMYHNVRMVHEWANTELRAILRKPEETLTERDRRIIALAEKAVEFRVFALLRLFQLTLWSVLRIETWPLAAMPSIAALRRCGDRGEFDLLALYHGLQEAVAGLALARGLRFHDEVRAAF